jgi:hypothetical protein
MTYIAITVPTLALAFTVLSFWWIYAREGALEVTPPRIYAFTTQVRLRLPLAFFNTGAKALVVTDLRLTAEFGDRSSLAWITTRTKLRPEPDDGFAYATPFSIAGRGTREVIAEFGGHARWTPNLSQCYRMQLEARVHPSDEWKPLLTFPWHAPPTTKGFGQYITYANTPDGELGE